MKKLREALEFICIAEKAILWLLENKQPRPKFN